MASNTKLNQYEKADLRDMRANQKLEIARTVDSRTTIAFQTLGNTVRFSTAVASPDEKKIRNKVGEYNARMRFVVGQFAVLSHENFGNFLFIIGAD